jgi:CBS domain containing-hemolysin-like protein
VRADRRRNRLLDRCSHPGPSSGRQAWSRSAAGAVDGAYARAVDRPWDGTVWLAVTAAGGMRGRARGHDEVPLEDVGRSYDYRIASAAGLAAIVVLILVCGVFVAAEFALVTVDRSTVERDALAGRRGARVTEAALRKLSTNLSSAQLGITLTSLIIGFIAEPTVARLIEPALGDIVGDERATGTAIALALGIATAVQMVVGELVPKSLAVAHPTRVAYALAGPLRWFGIVFGPLIRLLNGAANRAVRLVGIEPQEELRSVRSLDELELLIRSSGEEGTLEPGAFTLLTRTIRFGGKTAADALVPRTALHYLTADDTVADLARAAIDSGFSRFPVCENGDLDDVYGVVHVKDVYRVPYADRATTRVTDVASDAYVVPETKELTHLLVEMRRRGTQFALVVDEYGGTAGGITLEDVLEEIVGDITDEHDPASPTLTRVQRQGEWLVDGRLHRDEVFDTCGFEVPEGDYETLAGFVLDRLGHIPDAGERFEHDGWAIEVVAMDRLRVATVRLVAPSAHIAPGGGG